MAGAVTCGLFPLALLVLAMVESEHETMLGINGLFFGVIIILAGFVLCFATRKLWTGSAVEASPEAAD